MAIGPNVSDPKAAPVYLDMQIDRIFTNSNPMRPERIAMETFKLKNGMVPKSCSFVAPIQ